ncbi:MAG: GIY-YIG nuclease family protein [Haloferacaceae archaeon]
MTGTGNRDSDDLPSEGTYTLVIGLEEPVEIRVGALGLRRFDAPAYCYTGSAFGTGGFSRVDRHRRLAAGEHDARHWHVDYLLGHPETRLAGVVKSHGAEAECPIARRLGEGPIEGFGASDCDCRSHLVDRQNVREALAEAKAVHVEETDPAAVALETA